MDETLVRRIVREELDRLGVVKANPPIFPLTPAPNIMGGCPKCGLGADGKVMGVVCMRSDCPSKVTC